ncbi:hypothetical protein E2C06_01050 [Dankookia rubra]|uniref:HPt domain-containing protein n=1 Tax=Dankookia rubra TaxID=1442381 RepID=A0A4R5QPI5_9PROT|nr:Hpt domain-containing protein [Dankookia rubra]TDH64561.1 hypothetical protein E2C06_01050 [Dankookia rubra]
MELDPDRPLRTAMLLGGAAAFGALAWAVTLHVLALGPLPSSILDLGIRLIPTVLCSMVLAFGAGLWFGRRRLAVVEAALGAASQARFAAVQDELQHAAVRAEAETRRIALLLDSAAPGAALFDGQHCLSAWSQGFAALAEVPEAALQAGLPLADLVRLQPASPTGKLSRHGIESGIAGAARRQRRDGSHVEDRWEPEAGGGMLLTCRPAAPPRQATPFSAADLAALCKEEVRTRMPRLQAAIAAGDAPAARLEAHAIRGVAASFGLDDLAETLLVVETAARAGDLAKLATASPGLPQCAEAGLRRLLHQPA